MEPKTVQMAIHSEYRKRGAENYRREKIVRRPITVLAMAIMLVLTSMTVASAVTVEKSVNGGCRIGAQAYESWTKATHVSYDDNGGCAKIAQKNKRRCWGSNYTYSTQYTSAEVIDLRYAGCDALYTITYAKDVNWNYLGSVKAEV
ncbi:MAG: hypothetical protein GXP34_12495 [Actinobacteria bacterium]|nr:hypothetical protein [Actinomycetota bacterium]